MNARISFSASRWVRGAILIAVTPMFGGCMTPPADPVACAECGRTNDPLEPLNRKTFALNLSIDHAVIRPIAKAYMTVVPDDARRAVHNVLDNIKEPTLFFDNMLQGEFKRASVTLGRLIVNSTVGFGGIVDVMALNGVDQQKADFGQTLYVWGAPSGPYLVLPILGPSNPRDAIGGAVDSYADPVTILGKSEDVQDLLVDRFVIAGVDERAGVLDALDDLEKNSVDFYAKLRSLSQQRRAAELRHAETPAVPRGLYSDPGLKNAPPRP